MDHRPAAPASIYGSHTVPPLSERLVDELLNELRSERDGMREQNKQLAQERKSERNWRILFQFALFGLPLLGTLAYVLFFTSTMGFQWGPFGSVVGVVRIDGEIASSGLASAKRVVPLLKKAFENPSVETVVLSIDSPGGAPVEAERIYDAIEHFKAKNPKPVFAVINNLGASAAYMIALHTDKISMQGNTAWSSITVRAKREEAKALGLIDGIGTLEEVIATTWGQKAYDFGPAAEGFGPFSA